MLQKTNLNKFYAIKGIGKVDDNRPIDLKEYVIPYSQSLRENLIPIISIPQKIFLSKKIGKTVYDITANFNIEGKESILQQFKNLIISTKL